MEPSTRYIIHTYHTKGGAKQSLKMKPAHPNVNDFTIQYVHIILKRYCCQKRIKVSKVIRVFKSRKEIKLPYVHMCNSVGRPISQYKIESKQNMGK
jgi:hypothetical protein